MSGFEDLTDEEVADLREILRTHEIIIKLRNEGKSYKEIANSVG